MLFEHVENLLFTPIVHLFTHIKTGQEAVMEALKKQEREQEFLTVEQVADRTSIPAATLRRYVTLYRRFLSLSRGPKNSILVSPESAHLLAQVRVWITEKKKPSTICKLLKIQKDLSEQKGNVKGEKTFVDDGSLVLFNSDQFNHSEQVDHLPVLVNQIKNLFDQMENLKKEQKIKMDRLERENLVLRNRLLMLEAHQVELNRAMETPLWKKVLGKIWKS